MSAAITSQIVWEAPTATNLPDAEAQVLLAYPEGVCEGFLDGTDEDGCPIWRDATAWRVEGVFLFAAMPDPHPQFFQRGSAANHQPTGA